VLYSKGEGLINNLKMKTQIACGHPSSIT